MVGRRSRTRSESQDLFGAWVVVKREVEEETGGGGGGGGCGVNPVVECLICLKSTSGEDQPWKEPLQPQQEDSLRQPSPPLILTRNVQCIFLLRHLLQYPQEECSSLLSSTGLDPGRWCVLCQQCSNLVRDAFQLHLEVAKLTRQIRGIGAQLKTAMKNSFPNSSDGGGDQEVEDEWNEPPSPETLNVQWSIRKYFKDKPSSCGGGGGKELEPISAIPHHHDEEHDVSTLTLQVKEEYLELRELEDNDNINIDNSLSDSDPDFSPPVNFVNRKKNSSNSPKSRRRRNRSTRANSRTNSLSETPDEMVSAAPAPALPPYSSETEEACSTTTGTNTTKEEKRRTQGIKERSVAISSSRSSTTLLSPRKKVRLKKRQSGGGGGKGQEYNCRTCKATFTSSIKYYEHRRSRHNPESELGIPRVQVPSLGSKKSSRTARVCKICNFQVIGISLIPYRDHMLSHENDDESSAATATTTPTHSHSCTQCSKSFHLKLNLDLHKLIVHDTSRVKLKCDQCGAYNHDTREELIAHLKTHSDSEWIYSCKSCPMSYSSMSKMLQHMKNHSIGITSPRLECPLCDDFIGGSHKELCKHVEKCHPSALAQTFPCPICPNRSYFIAYKLSHHMLLAHGSTKAAPEVVETEVEAAAHTHICQHCGKTYKSKTSLENHIGYMHDEEEGVVKPHKCDQCAKAFRFRSLLQAHVQEKHDRLRFGCDICPNKSFSCRTSLNHHMRIHTGEDLRTCHACGAQFPTTSQLNVHLSSHEVAEEAARTCELCGKRVKNERRLKTHMNAVHKERRHECHHCGLKFARKDNLRSHMRTHTGERPYSCPDCGKSFNRKDILRIHCKGHQGRRSHNNHSSSFIKSEEDSEQIRQ